jgi:hypothetical protein
LAGDLNAKHPFWSSAVSNPLGEKLMSLFDLNEFEISAPQCPTHYSPLGNGDVLDIVVHQYIRVSDVIVSDILDSGHLPIVFHILIMSILETFQNLLTNSVWDWFQRLAAELISPTIKINLGIEADKAASDFTASVASAYRLSTSKVTLSDINDNLPGLDWLLKHRQRLRKLWHEIRDPVCKTVVNWITESIRQMTRKNALE